jgi:saccharopine dehydrogenase-like NADP-dependent oxidoreductase
MEYVGKDADYTAMSDTVGLPLGIAAKMVLNGKIRSRGVLLPTDQEIYTSVLEELETYGVKFKEELTQVT